MHQTQAHNRLLIAASFFSGMASLAYQVVWQRCLTQEVGVDSVSTAIVITTFLLGLALGYRRANLISEIKEAHFALLYCFCEFLIGAFGILSVPLLRELNTLSFPPGYYLDLVANAVVLLVPTFFMGLSMPLLAACMRVKQETLGSSIGSLYGANVLGASMGSFFSGLVALELWGLTGTTWIAAAFNFLALGLMVYAQKISPRIADIWDSARFLLRAPKVEKPRFAKISHRSVLGCLLFGFAGLAFEMTAFRSLSYQFGLAAYVFPILLGIYLLLMACGEWLGGKIADYDGGSAWTPLWIFVLSTGAVLLALRVTPLLSTAPLGSNISRLGLFRAVSAGILFLLPVVFLSAYFPLLLKRLTRQESEFAKRTSDLLFYFTIANALGGLFTTFVLFSQLGSLLTIAVCVGAVGLGVILESRRRIVATSLTLASVVAVILGSQKYYERIAGSEGILREVVEDKHGILTVRETANTDASINLFQTPTATAMQATERVVDEISNWNFSSFFHLTGEKPKRVLVIGLGSGMVVHGLTRFSFIESIDVVELLPEVTRLLFKYSTPEMTASLGDPRVKIRTGDGRRFVRREHLEPYDLIQVGVFFPWTSGASNLYTIEFFRELSKVLSPSGFIAVHNHSALVDATALKVFPYGYRVETSTTHRFNYFRKKPISDWETGNDFSKQMCEQSRHESGPATVYQAASAAPDHYQNEDNRPLLEYFFLRQMLHRFFSWDIRPQTETAVTFEKKKELEIKCFHEKIALRGSTRSKS